MTGDKASPSGKARLPLRPHPHGGLQSGDPHQVRQLSSDIFTPSSFNRPEIDVYVRTFDGFALTADTWERQRQILLDDLIGKRVRTQLEFLENLLFFNLIINIGFLFIPFDLHQLCIVQVKDDEWFCNMYNSPMEMTNRSGKDKDT